MRLLEQFDYRIVKKYRSFIDLIKSDSVKISVAYKFSILVIFDFFVSIFFNPLTGIIAQDSVFYLNIIGASLCVMFLLSDVWLPHNKNNILRYLWYFILFFYLPFFATYTWVRSFYYWSWLINLGLSTILLALMTSRTVFFLTLVPGIIAGIVFGIVLNLYFPPNPLPPYEKFDIYYATYSCTFLGLIIMLIIHNRVYVQKQLYNLIETEVRDRTKELQNALEIKKLFLDNVSHEIKTPIHNITNIAEILHEQIYSIVNQESKDLLDALQDSSYKLWGLCTNLLDLSKFKNGDQTLNIKRHNIIKIVNDLLQEFHKDNISLRIAQTFDKIVYCDAERITQVLRNLIQNAIQYGKNKQIEISLSDYDQDSIKLEISDHGIGIPPDELEVIFDSFEQSSRTKTKAGGIGLGLAICKKIIELHHGKIWAANNSSHGGLTIIGTKSSSKDFLFHLIFSNSNLTYCSGKGSQMWYVQ